MAGAVSQKRGSDYQGLSTKQRIARAGKALYSAYRIDHYADPNGFVDQVAAVFEQFDIEVVEAVTDPRNSGALQCVHKFPPTIAEIREALTSEATARERRRAAALTPRPQLNRAYVPPPKFPGCRANVIVPSNVPQFAMVEGLVQSGTLEPEDWVRLPDGGIKIGLSVWTGLYSRVTASESWKPMTDAEMRAHYGQVEAEASNEANRENARA